MLKMVLPSEAWVKVKLLSPQPSVYSQHFKNLAISFSNMLMLSQIHPPFFACGFLEVVTVRSNSMFRGGVMGNDNMGC